MAKGMEFMVKALLDSLDADTRAAIENIPRNVQTVALSLQTLDAKVSALLEAGTCARLEAIEIAVVVLQRLLDRHTIRLQEIQDALAQQKPEYTPDVSLPTFDFQGRLLEAVRPTMVDVVESQNAIFDEIFVPKCIYSDAIGPCKLPAHHPGPHECESNSMEAFGSGENHG